MKRYVPFVVAALVALPTTSPAAAVPPTHTSGSQQVTLTDPTACGSYGVS